MSKAEEKMRQCKEGIFASLGCLFMFHVCCIHGCPVWGPQNYVFLQMMWFCLSSLDRDPQHALGEVCHRVWSDWDEKSAAPNLKPWFSVEKQWIDSESKEFKYLGGFFLRVRTKWVRWTLKTGGLVFIIRAQPLLHFSCLFKWVTISFLHVSPHIWPLHRLQTVAHCDQE